MRRQQKQMPSVSDTPATRHPLYTQGQRGIAGDVAFPNNNVSAANKNILTLDGVRLIPSAEVINLNNNRLSNFYGMVTLPRMRCLYVEGNGITSFAGMSYQPGLEILSMEGNPLCLHPMFRVMALLCIGESLRIINHRAVSEAERTACQSFGGPASSAAKLISLGWVGLTKTPEAQSAYKTIIEEVQQEEFNSKVRAMYSVQSSSEMLEWSMQSFVERMRVEEGIAGFAAAASDDVSLSKERSQHGAYGMVVGAEGASLTGQHDLPPGDAVLGLRDHLYADAGFGRKGHDLSPVRRPPWDYTPAPVPPGPVFIHERLALDADSYNANDYNGPTRSMADGADRGGPARLMPQGRDIYSSTHHSWTGRGDPAHNGHAPSAAQYQEEVDRAVAIDTARTFLNRVRHGGSTAALSTPLDPRNPHPSAAEQGAIDIISATEQKAFEEEMAMKKWVEFHTVSRSQERQGRNDERKEPSAQGSSSRGMDAVPYSYADYTRFDHKGDAKGAGEVILFDDMPAVAGAVRKTREGIADLEANHEGEDPAASEASRRIQALSGRLFNGTVLSPYKVISREHEMRSLVKAARAIPTQPRGAAAAYSGQYSVRHPALLLNQHEARALASLTLGPVHIYTSIPDRSGPVESLRNAMIAGNMKRRSLTIAVGVDGTSRVVAEIPLADINDIELDSVSGGTLYCAFFHSSSLPAGGTNPPTIRLTLESGARMDIIPVGQSNRVAVARGIFKTLMLLKCDEEELQNLYER